MAIGTSGTIINYSGLIYNTKSTKTPLLNMFASYDVNHKEFPITQTYATGSPSQPEITATASLTAPAAEVVTREQQTNTTQIFQKSTGVSYEKLSNMGTLGGLNIANQESAIQNELDFQVGVKAQEIRNDMEFTIINGKYQRASGDGVAAKTRGLLEAITENVENVSGKDELKPDYIDAVMSKIVEKGGETGDLLLLLNPVQMRQLNKWYSKENGYLLPASRTVAGHGFDQIITPFGYLMVAPHTYVPAGTALIINPTVCRNVNQPVPGKGNFFWEELAKTGAGITGELFGQWGLDYGPSWYHGKITGLATTYTNKDYVVSTKAIA